VPAGGDEGTNAEVDVDGPNDGGGQTQGQSGGWTKVRRGLAFAIVVASAIAFAVSQTVDALQVCEAISTRAAKAVETSETCKPLAVQDLIPFLLVSLVLMWPDVTDIEVFGLGRITRRLDSQDHRQDRLEARISNVVSQTVEVNYASTPEFTLLADRVSAWVEGQGDVSAIAVEQTPSPQDGTQSNFHSRADPLRPYLEVARRLRHDKRFAEAVGAGGETPWENTELTPGDQQLLSSVATEGRFQMDDLLAWADHNAIGAQVVRDNLRESDVAAPDSLRIATATADRLWSDLRQRGLVKDGE
jgi:hypothetical protein